MAFFDRTLLENPYRSWLIAVAVAAAFFVVLSLMRTLLHRRLEAWSRRTATEFDDLAAEMVRRTRLYLLIPLSVALGALTLHLAPGARTILGKLVVISLIAQGAEWANAIIDHWIGRSGRPKGSEAPAGPVMVSVLGFVARLALWSLAILLALDNFGIDITALVAGLGIGGVAVALAAQNVLGDLFASIAIAMDKPFTIGEYITVGDLSGTVEHVGVKTTRIKGLGGEQLVFANSDLVKSRIRNFGKMAERRIAFDVGVTYQTPPDVLETIPTIIRSAVESTAKTRFDRSHLKGFGPYSLDFETVYFVTTPVYADAMDAQQSINLRICRGFAEAGIEFAYPTQSLFVAPLPGEKGIVSR